MIVLFLIIVLTCACSRLHRDRMIALLLSTNANTMGQTDGIHPSMTVISC